MDKQIKQNEKNSQQRSGTSMNVRELNLTEEQYNWLNTWLELWGGWVHSGRLEKRMSHVIAQYMATVEPQSYPSRPICNDDDGMLISQVVDSVLRIDAKAMGILLSYYAYQSTKHSIAVYNHKSAEPRKISTRGGNRLKRPSLSTCRREVEEILNASLYVLYQPLVFAFNNRQSVSERKKFSRMC